MRWTEFRNPGLLSNLRMGAPEMVFSATFALMGCIDVVLILWSRPGVLLLGFEGYSSPEGSDGSINGAERIHNNQNIRN